VGLAPARRGPPAVAKPGLATREAATAILSAVLADGHSLDRLLDPESGDGRYNALDPRDRRLAHAIVATALRRHGEIDALLSRLVEKRPRKAGQLFPIVEIAATQILFMDVADHAAVSLALDQISADRDARHFKGLANAVLRRIARERDAILTGSDPLTNAPDWLRRRWSATYGETGARAIATAHLVEPGLDLSVKSDPEGWAEKLGGVVLPTGSVRIVPAGPVEELAGYDNGAWWVQDAAAALPVKLLGDIAGKRIADLCAAPGGKTAALAVAGARVTAVDVSAARLKCLSQNLERLKLSAGVVAADILDWTPPEPFDAILLDAPCTTTGTIRRHPDIPWLKRESDIPTLASLQARMIDRAVSWLKPGGTLVYCTCSLEPEEGEGQLASARERHRSLAVVPVRPAEVGGLDEIVAASGAIRTLPTHLANPTPRLAGLDGFFIMRLRKS
jgi:16S rRNA (cytosine967-C5)-methyltransferase